MTASTMRPIPTGRGSSRTPARGAAAGRRRGGVDPDRERDGVSAADVAGRGAELARASAVAEHVVAFETHAREVADRGLVPVLGIHLLARILGQGDLRGG